MLTSVRQVHLSFNKLPKQRGVDHKPASGILDRMLLFLTRPEMSSTPIIRANPILAALNKLGRIRQPRMTRIMSLLLLATDIQEVLRHLPEVMQGKVLIHEKLLRPLTTEINWRVQ